MRLIRWKFTLSKPQTLKTQQLFDFALTVIASNQAHLVFTLPIEKDSEKDRKKRNHWGLGILGSLSHPSCKWTTGKLLLTLKIRGERKEGKLNERNMKEEDDQVDSFAKKKKLDITEGNYSVWVTVFANVYKTMYVYMSASCLTVFGLYICFSLRFPTNLFTSTHVP